MKKITCMVLFTMLLFALSSCGGSGASSNSQPEDPSVTAEREFNNAVGNLSNAQSSLLGHIADAETLLKTVTEEDVSDPNVLENLREVLEAINVDTETSAPEIESELEKIQAQTQSISSQADEIWSIYYGLDTAIYQVEESQQAKRTEYENMDLFDAARSMGYEVEELSFGSLGCYVSFSYNEASFVISSANEPSGDILFYGKKIEKKDLSMGTFAFTTFYFSDGGNASRDSGGHWTFSTEQKEQLLNMLSNFKKRGPSSFLDVLTPLSSNYLSSEMSALVKELNLSVAYQKVSGGYRFMVSDGESLAWFAAIYSDADFRPSDNASGLYTYADDQYKTAGFLGSAFLTDYVTSDGHLVSEPERANQLREFFASAGQRFLTSIAPTSQHKDIVVRDNRSGTTSSGIDYSNYILLFSRSENPSITWNLGGKYSTLAGLWIMDSSFDSPEEETVEMYADGVLAYSSPAISGQEFDEINISISNCQELKIVFTSSSGRAKLADIALYK